MADDITQQNEPIDIDSMKVSILLIVKNKSQFGSVIQFLNRRDWKCTVVSQMDETIKVLSKEQPDFVFLSFNHPNPKMLRLPNLLAQVFNATCVGFCETPDLKTESRLTASKIRYKLVGAASGPSIHRRVKQILSEMYGLNDNENKDKISGNSFSSDSSGESVSFKGSKQSNIVQVKGSTSSPGSSTGFGNMAYMPNHKKKANRDQNELLKQLQSALGGDDSEESMEASMSNEVIDSIGENEVTQTGAEAKTSSTKIMKGSEKSKNGFSIQEGEKTTKGFAIQEGPSSNNHFSLMEGQKSEANTLIAKGAKGKSNFLLSNGEQAEASLILSKSSTNESSSINNNSAEESESNIDLIGKIPKTKKAQSEKLIEQKTFLKAAIEKAVEVIEPSEKFENQDLKRTKFVGIIPVSGEGLNGYLMVCSTVIENFSIEKLTQLKEALLREFKVLGKKVSLHSEMLVNTIEVDIIDWSEQMSALSLELEFGKGYLIVTYIETDFKIPVLEIDKEKNKIIVPFESIIPGSVLNFDAYIYMDKNQKFITYGKEGRSLSKKQIENLIANQKTLYIEKDSVDAFKHYFSTSVINDLIDYYLKNNEEKVG